jgi:phenylacetate-CoA ligase
LLACTMDRCFIAGLAYFLGLRNIGASVVRNGVGNIESHVEIINRLKPTVIIGVPTFLKKLGVYLRDTGLGSAFSNVNRLICIGEPIRDRDMHPLYIAEELEKLWEAKVYSTYASTETITTFCECEEQYGGHLLSDLAIVEIVDEQGNVQSNGELGEVVVTPLSVEGMPLIRFKTGDISFLIDEPCRCGRNSPRLGPIVGRKKQMMKVYGTTIYPQSIFSVLDEVDFVLDYFLEVFNESELSDQVQVSIALKEDIIGAEKIISEKIKARIRVKLQVSVLTKETLMERIYESGLRKPVRLFDKRSKHLKNYEL